MTIWRLFFQEIRYRRWPFLMAVLSVVVAAGCVVAELTILRLHDAASKNLLAAKEQEMANRIAAQEAETKVLLDKIADEIRKDTNKLGFNILIVSDKEDLLLLSDRKVAVGELPEAYVQELANSKVATIQHLLPMVQSEIDLPGLPVKVVLTGVRGEVPILHASEKKPLLQPVPKGTVVLGSLVHQQLKLKKGDQIAIQGKKFTVHDVHPPRGENRDDLTVWINLAEAQELLHREGKINAILALECNCASVDRLAEVRAEVEKILPHTQVLEFASKAVVRAEVREKNKKAAKDALAQKKAHAASELTAFRATRDEMRQQLMDFAALLVPLVLLGSIVWLGVMSLNNVRERQAEVGILRALGLNAGSIYILFVGRAVVVGLAGALLGCGLGICAGGLCGETALAGTQSLFEPWLFLSVLLAAPALCAGVGWLAALAAARQDPAVVLQQA